MPASARNDLKKALVSPTKDDISTSARLKLSEIALAKNNFLI